MIEKQDIFYRRGFWGVITTGSPKLGIGCRHACPGYGYYLKIAPGRVVWGEVSSSGWDRIGQDVSNRLR